MAQGASEVTKLSMDNIRHIFILIFSINFNFYHELLYGEFYGLTMFHWGFPYFQCLQRALKLIELAVYLFSHMAAPRPDARYPDCIAIAYEDCNKKITTIYNDHSMYVWDVSNLKKVGKSRSYMYHSACIWGVEVSPSFPVSILHIVFVCRGITDPLENVIAIIVRP